jgi:hypothetical protein
MELKFPMVVFLVLSALYLVGLGLMFDSHTFRWTFVLWGFFGLMVTISGLLTLTGLVVGIMCRLNFDKGLSHYRKRIPLPSMEFCIYPLLLVNAEEPLSGDGFTQAVPGEGHASDEKVDFPSTLRSIPSFSATLGPSKMASPSSQMGPRFFNQPAAPFDQRADIESALHSSVARSTSPKMDSPESLTRQDSQHSTSSLVSSTVTTNEYGRSRWVIE